MMNERIEQLAEQCRIEERNQYGDLIEFGFDEEKFAELIVRECISKCEFYNDSNWGPASECIAQDIKQHFGVEE